jgi:hypothetical protein
MVHDAYRGTQSDFCPIGRPSELDRWRLWKGHSPISVLSTNLRFVAFIAASLRRSHGLFEYRKRVQDARRTTRPHCRRSVCRGSDLHKPRRASPTRACLPNGVPSNEDASLTQKRLSALTSHPATAERPRHRYTASRRVAPSLPAPRGLTAPTTTCHWLRGGRYRLRRFAPSDARHQSSARA